MPIFGWCNRRPRAIRRIVESADDVYRALLALPGVSRAANVTYLTMQVRLGNTDVRAMVVGFEPGQPGEPSYPGRRPADYPQPLRSGGRCEDRLSTQGDTIRIRRHDYRVVGPTRRMVSSGGDPMVFIPLKDAQEAQFLAITTPSSTKRARTTANPT